MGLRSIILNAGLRLTETSKYGMPCYCRDRQVVCYLWQDSKSQEPYVLFADGQELSHPQLVTGKRKRMSILPINPKEDLPVDLIHKLLEQAISLKKQAD